MYLHCFDCRETLQFVFELKDHVNHRLESMDEDPQLNKPEVYLYIVLWAMSAAAIVGILSICKWHILK